MKDKRALISVCIPVYNGARYLAKTLDSVVSQTYKDIEILVQDNQSTDGTAGVLKAYAAKYPFIKIETNSKNLPMAANWSLVINRALGEYFVLLSADDLLEEKFLERCLVVFEKRSDILGVTVNHFLMRGKRVNLRNINIKEGGYSDFLKMALLRNPFSINFTLFSRKLAEKMKINGELFPRYLYTSDYDLWLRIATSGYEIYYLEENLGKYRFHQESLSAKRLKMLKHKFLTLLLNKKMIKIRSSIVYRLIILRLLLTCVFYLLRHKLYNRRLINAVVGELFN